jgi:predicted permease
MVTTVLRRWRLEPLAAVSTLGVVAVGTAASSVLFAVLYAVALAPLPYADAGRLIVVQDHSSTRPDETRMVPGRFRDVREAVSRDARLAALWPGLAFNSADDRGAVRLSGSIVTDDLLSVLGRRVDVGRGFSAADGVPTAPPVALISHALWRSAFGGRQDIPGRSLRLDGRVYEIVGVLPSGLPLPAEDADVWLPLQLTVWNRVSRNLVVIGRLHDGVTTRQLERALEQSQSVLARENPDTDAALTPSAADLRAALGGSVRGPIVLVFLASGVVDCLVAFNLGVLLVARVTARRHEIAVRRALGAGALDVAMLGVTEAALVAVAGSAAGLILARATLPAVVALVAGVSPTARATDATAFSWPALLAASLAAMTIAAVAAAVPSFLAGRVAPFESLRVKRSATGRVARRTLVVIEIAGALVLVTMAAAVAANVLRLRAADPGLRPADVLTARVALPAGTYTASSRRAVAAGLVDQAQALPGVTAAAVGSALPFGGAPAPFNLRPDNDPTTTIQAEHRSVGPAYFDALGIRLLAGRTFEPGDREDAAPVAILSVAVARRIAGSSSLDAWRGVVGRRLSVDGPGGPWRAIVGVVDDTRYAGLGAAGRGELYLPWAQDPWPQLTLVVRHAAGVDLTRAQLAAALAVVDPSLPLHDVAPLADRIEASLGVDVLLERGFTAFAALAIVLAVFGVYALLVWAVEARRLEFGIRTALGASPARLSLTVLRETAALALAGVGAGLPLAWAAGRSISALVPDFSPPPSSILMACLVGLIASVIAGALPPMRRAARTDPATALRSDA